MKITGKFILPKAISNFSSKNSQNAKNPKKNQKPEKKSKTPIIALIIIALSIGLSAIIANYIKTNFSKKEELVDNINIDIDYGETLKKPESPNTEIDLSNYDTNITISEAGEYLLTGDFSHSIIINAPETVTLRIFALKINNSDFPSILNLSSNALILAPTKSSVSQIENSGNNPYNAAIYSYGTIILDGETSGELEIKSNLLSGYGIKAKDSSITIQNGSLTIYSCASERTSGIDADYGFSINGGYLFSYGRDMLEQPARTSTQPSIVFDLDETIPKGSSLRITDSHHNLLYSFSAKEDFRTLIFSTPYIAGETFTLSVNGKTTKTVELSR